jgi:hypothetical protein
MNLIDLLLEIQSLSPTTDKKETINQIQKKYSSILDSIRFQAEGIVLRVLTDKIRKATTSSSSSTEIQSTLLKSLIDDMKKLGWYPQYSTWSKFTNKPSYDKDELNWNKEHEGSGKFVIKNVNKAVADTQYKSIWIKFYANFDKKADKLLSGVTKIYHVTPKSNLDKILNRGLVPKNSGVYAPYPNRIFFGTSKKVVSDLFKYDEFRFKIQDAVFLEINLKKAPDATFYIDPESNGIYTYDVIPRGAIKIYRGG